MTAQWLRNTMFAILTVSVMTNVHATADILTDGYFSSLRIDPLNPTSLQAIRAVGIISGCSPGLMLGDAQITDNELTVRFYSDDVCDATVVGTTSIVQIGHLDPGEYQVRYVVCTENPPPLPSPCNIIANESFIVTETLVHYIPVFSIYGALIISLMLLGIGVLFIFYLR